MDALTLFFFVSCLTLLKLSHDDWKNQLIDVRLSYYMQGLLSTLFLLQGQILGWIVLILGFTLALPFIKKKVSNIIADGDLTVLSWVLPGIMLFNWIWLPIWLIVYGSMIGLFYFVFKKVKQPGIPIIFFTTLIVWGLVLIKLI